MKLLSVNLPYNLLQTTWSSSLNPLLASPLAQPRLLKNVALLAGDNTINHGLPQALQGYAVVLNSAPAAFYDLQNTNPTPDKTLVLNVSQATVVTLMVF